MADIVLKKPVAARVVAAPTSKSAAHRLLIAAVLGDAPTAITLSGAGEDIAATRRCLAALGAKIEEKEATDGTLSLCVTPIKIPAPDATLDCGESGSTLRFLVPVAAALGTNARFLRRGRLSERPMTPLLSLLAANGVSHTENADGSLSLRGKLGAGDYAIPADVSSQFVTGMLFALATMERPSTLTLVGEIESAPYLDMTLSALRRFGVGVERSEDGRLYRIAGRAATPFHSPASLLPEGDFSGAAFPLAAGAIGSHPVTVTGLDLNSAQGDRAILSLLARFGAKVEEDAAHGSVTVSPAPLHGIKIDARQIPDLVPVLAVLGAVATGKTEIFGAARLRLKESDRIATTLALLRALGARAEEREDGLTIFGGAPLTGGVADGANDHRIVMSAAIAALVAKGDVTVKGVEAVAKSYPRFFADVII